MTNFLIESTSPILYDYLQDFIQFVNERLGIDDLPISLVMKTNKASFGSYRPGHRTIEVATGGRHVADILRTLAHEMVHDAQHKDGEPNRALDELEYEANAVAGMLMREYNKLHPELYDADEEPEPNELDDMLGVGAAPGSLENAGTTVDAFQTPSYEGLADAQPMRPPYPVELAESMNSVGSGNIASVGNSEPGLPIRNHENMEDPDWHHQGTHIHSLHHKGTTQHHSWRGNKGPTSRVDQQHILTHDRNKTLQKWRKDHESRHTLTEDAVVNSAGSGAVAGIGVGPQGEPGIYNTKKKKTPMFKRKTFSQLRERKD